MNLTLTLPEPPSTAVKLLVSDRSGYCGVVDPSAEKRLAILKTKGLTVSIAKIVAYAARYFDGISPRVYIPVVSGTPSSLSKPERFFAAWLLLSMASPRVDGKRLIFDDTGNERIKSTIGEIFGIGIALIVAEHLYGVKEPLWTSTSNNDYFDFFGKDQNNHVILLEARGRFEANNLGAAVKQVERKFKDQTAKGKMPFDYAVGVIACPRCSVRKRAVDVVVVDPEGDGVELERFDSEKRILTHYLQFFADQNLRFSDSIRRVLELPDTAFGDYLQKGDAVMQSLMEGIAVAWRASFRFRGREYGGTVYEYGRSSRLKLLGAKISIDGDYLAYWCLDKEIARFIASGEVSAILSYQGESGYFTFNGIQLFLYADGTAIAIGPSDRMKRGMFDGFDPHFDTN